MEKYNFLGVSSQTSQKITSHLEKVQKYAEVYQELDKLVKKYGIDNLAILSAEYMKAFRGLMKSLQEAEEQAILPSDKEEINNIIQFISPLINIFGDLGESLLTNSTEEQIVEDNNLSELIGGALS